MKKCLYLLCPTDCLETIINNTFNTENYFYTSLGNSFNADKDTLKRIKCVVQKYHIRKIFFVLANDNKIIQNALEHQGFSDIKGLHGFFTEISTQKEQLVVIPNNDAQQFSITSQYLNKKIQKLQLEFDDISIKISAKIYDRDKNVFSRVYSNLVCLEKYQLN